MSKDDFWSDKNKAESTIDELNSLKQITDTIKKVKNQKLSLKKIIGQANLSLPKKIQINSILIMKSLFVTIKVRK